MRKVSILIVLTVIFLLGCTVPEQDIVNDNKLQINIDGYIETCINEPNIFVNEGGNWRAADIELPGKGMYFLDGEYIGYGMCDVVVCDEIRNPMEIELVEYVEVGERESLETEGYIVSEFSTKQLSGEIKVELKYYTDSDCKDEKTFTTTVNN